MQQGKEHWNWKGGKKLTGMGYIVTLCHEHPRANGGYVFEHIVIAEKIIGKPLPKGAEIHHYGEKTDNTRFVICENRAYHKLLHVRMRALKACGHANWRKCNYCKKYDHPDNLYIKGHATHHQNCRNEHRRVVGQARMDGGEKAATG